MRPRRLTTLSQYGLSRATRSPSSSFLSLGPLLTRSHYSLQVLRGSVRSASSCPSSALGCTTGRSPAATVHRATRAAQGRQRNVWSGASSSGPLIESQVVCGAKMGHVWGSC